MEQVELTADDLTRGSQAVLSSGSVPHLGGLQQLELVPTSQEKLTRDTDLYGWLVQQATELRSRQPDFIDWDELAEELDEIVALARKETVSHFRNLLAHLLKWKYQNTNRAEHSWHNTIVRARLDLSLLLDSKNLRNYVAEKGYALAYRQAREQAGSEMHLDQHTWNRLFPHSCEWDLETTLNSSFFPSPASDSNETPSIA
jgi:hypothetical protein